MEFTREQLEHFDRRLAGEMADFALRQLDKIAGLELDAEDAREDIDALDQQVVKLRAQLATAEAERDILQWASEHAGGGGSLAGSGAGGGGKVTRDGWYVHKFGPLGEWISSEPKKPDPYPEGEASDDDESCDCGIVRIPELPERPHESLVWAMYHADGISIGAADAMLEQWRARWPEPKA